FDCTAVGVAADDDVSHAEHRHSIFDGSGHASGLVAVGRDHVAGITADEQVTGVGAGDHVRVDSCIGTGEDLNSRVMTVGVGIKQGFELRVNVLANIQYAANNVVHSASSCRSGNLDQHCARRNPVALGDVNRLHGAVHAGVNFGFHFHGFGDHHRLASGDSIAFLDQYIHHIAGHGGGDMARIRGLLAAATAG